MTTVLAIVRAGHLLALMIVFGAEALKAIYRARLPTFRVNFLPPRAMVIAAGVALATAICWLLLVVHSMSSSWTVDDLRLALTSTTFGYTMMARLVLLAGLVFVTLLECPLAGLSRIVLSGAALAAIAITSHAAASGSPTLLRAGNDALHLLAAAFWIGSLGLLLPIVLTNRKSPTDLVAPLRIFSLWAMVAVAILVAAGTANAVMILWISPSRWSPVYLSLLSLKIVLAAVMVSLALANRFSLLPGIRSGQAEAEENLLLSVSLELAIGIGIVGIVGILGLLPYGQ